MYESSTTGLLFVIYLSSLARLPRVLADGPTCEITSEQEQQIVETHNWLRSTVSPNATNMRRMVSEIHAHYFSTTSYSVISVLSV